MELIFKSEFLNSTLLIMLQTFIIDIPPHKLYMNARYLMFFIIILSD